MQARFQTQKAWMQEGSRYHGSSDPNGKPFLNYELAKLVDLTDANPADSPYPNSTKMPRRPNENGNDIDYSQLFSQTYADYYAFPDPANAGHNLDSVRAVSAKGIVKNDIFFGREQNRARRPNAGDPRIQAERHHDDKDGKKPGKIRPVRGQRLLQRLATFRPVNACRSVQAASGSWR